jgi:hypothetical protein
MGIRELVAHYYTGKPRTEQQLMPLYGALLLYVFRGCKQQSVRKLIAHHEYEFDFLSWRRNLSHMGTLLKDVKLWTYWFYVNGVSLKEVPISVREKNSLKLALKFKPLQRHLHSLHTEYGAQPLTPSGLDAMIKASLYSDDVSAFLRSQVRTKMSFLVQSFGYTAHDLVCELSISALNALLKSYPRYEDVGHMRAICKSAAHNHSINFIHTNTTDGRQRLRKNEDGSHSNMLVPIDMFGSDQSVTGSDGIVSATLVSGIDGVTASQWEQMFALRQLQNHPRMTPRHRQFFNLALGKPDGAFSAYLGQPNDHLIERKDYNDYLNHVCKYMGLAQESMQSFLSSLKSHL